MRDADDLRDGFLSPLSQLKPGPEESFDLGSPEEASKTIKQVSKLFGADLVGICEFDERWVYTQRYARSSSEGKPEGLPVGLPENLQGVIVIGQAMDHDLVDTVPSALSGAAVGLGYSKDALVLLASAEWVLFVGFFVFIKKPTPITSMSSSSPFLIAFVNPVTSLSVVLSILLSCSQLFCIVSCFSSA